MPNFTLPVRLIKISSAKFLRELLSVCLLSAALAAQAATIWNGPNTSFFHTPQNLLQDQLTADVIFNRSTNGGGLYNSALEAGASAGSSPKGTRWAIGTLTNFNTLTYGACPLEMGGKPPGYIGTSFVVHLTNAVDDIYLQLTLTNWGGANMVGARTFGYIRSTPGAPAPAVTITNPAGGAVFAAPANVAIGASATVSSGTVTNVQFFTNSIPLGSVASAPFTLTANNLAAGAYALKAVATAAGISATSTVVNITVDAPPLVSITNPISGTVFLGPASVTIHATASDADGSVTNVQFVVGSTVLTNESTAPFSATTNNLPAGSYTLSAIASDNNGIKATNSVNIIVDAPPTVNITAPANNATLSAPANVTIQASAFDSDGSVTNVQLLIGATVLTNQTSAPFSASTNNLPAGSYALSAIASDNLGVKNTNVISISVVAPVTVVLGGAAKSSAATFQFSYPANIGLSYVVQSATSLAPANWIPLATNVAASNPVVFVDLQATNNPGFYRVGLLPNP